MKFSQILHLISVVVGLFGLVTVVVAVSTGANVLVLGITREHLLFCSMIIFLIAIWTQLATIHHVMIEKRGKIL